MINPNWYCKEVEFRAVREDDKYEVGCDCCGFKGQLYDRRYPKESLINSSIEKGCTCD